MGTAIVEIVFDAGRVVEGGVHLIASLVEPRHTFVVRFEGLLHTNAVVRITCMVDLPRLPNTYYVRACLFLDMLDNVFPNMTAVRTHRIQYRVQAVGSESSATFSENVCQSPNPSMSLLVEPPYLCIHSRETIRQLSSSPTPVGKPRLCKPGWVLDTSNTVAYLSTADMKHTPCGHILKFAGPTGARDSPNKPDMSFSNTFSIPSAEIYVNRDVSDCRTLLLI